MDNANQKKDNLDVDYRKIIPISDARKLNDFSEVHTLEDFLRIVINSYFSEKDIRLKEGYLSVYQAMRDHYPSYLQKIDSKTRKILDDEISINFSRMIKLRRIALSELAKVA